MNEVQYTIYESKYTCVKKWSETLENAKKKLANLFLCKWIFYRFCKRQMSRMSLIKSVASTRNVMDILLSRQTRGQLLQSSMDPERERNCIETYWVFNVQ